MRDRMEVDRRVVKRGCKGVTRIARYLERESLAACTVKCASVRSIVLKGVINGKVAQVPLNGTQTQITSVDRVLADLTWARIISLARRTGSRQESKTAFSLGFWKI
jgi:hypothetical protein